MLQRDWKCSVVGQSNILWRHSGKKVVDSYRMKPVPRMACMALAITSLISCGNRSGSDLERDPGTEVAPEARENLVSRNVVTASLLGNASEELPAVDDTGPSDSKHVMQPRGAFGRPIVRRSGRLVVGPSTQISVSTVLDPSVRVSQQIAVGGERGLSNLVSGPIVERLRAAGRPWNIFDNSGRMRADRDNIIIIQEIGLNRSGVPYRVALTARQGTSSWSAVLERPFARELAPGVPVLPDGRTADGREYWHVTTDATQLAGLLRDEINLRSTASANNRRR